MRLISFLRTTYPGSEIIVELIESVLDIINDNNYEEFVSAIVAIQLLLYNKFFDVLPKPKIPINDNEMYTKYLMYQSNKSNNSIFSEIISMNVLLYFIDTNINNNKTKFFYEILNKNEYKNYVIKDNSIGEYIKDVILLNGKISNIICKNTIIHFIYLLSSFMSLNTINEIHKKNAIGKYINQNKKLVICIKNVCINAINLLDFYCNNNKIKEECKMYISYLLLIINPWLSFNEMIAVFFDENNKLFIGFEEYNSFSIKNKNFNKFIIDRYNAACIKNTKLTKKELIWRIIKEYDRHRCKSELNCGNIECKATNAKLADNECKKGWIWKFHMCKRCKIVYYCSKKCQKIDWNKYNHRIICSLAMFN